MVDTASTMRAIGRLAAVLGLLLASGPAGAMMTVSALERSVLADATGLSIAEFDRVQDQQSSDQTGAFDTVANAAVSIDAAAGSAFASQRTIVDPSAFSGRGSADAGAFTSEDFALSDLAAESYLRLAFGVDRPTTFALEAALSASAGGAGEGFAAFDLLDDDGALFSLSAAPGDRPTGSLAGVLQPGRRYELLAFARGLAHPSDLSTGDGSSGFTFSFSVPEPAPGALLALALLAATRRARTERAA